MNTAKLLFSTLVAAAAMTANAYAATSPTVDATDSTKLSFSGDSNTQMVPGENNTSSYTLTFDNVTGYFGASQNSNETFNQNIVISGLTSTDGWGSQITTFSGTVTGSGDLTIKAAGLGQDFVFTGDVSGYTGNISSAQVYSSSNSGFSTSLGNSNSGVIQFGASTAATSLATTNISGKGSISTTGVLRYSYTDGGIALSVGNSFISAKALEFVGGANYTVACKVELGSALTVDGGSVTFAEGASLAFTGLTADTTFEDLTASGKQKRTHTYTIATGAGTLSGLTTSNLSIEGKSVTGLSDGNKTATIEESWYYIASGDTKTYSEIKDGVVGFNVYGTLDVGSIDTSGGNTTIVLDTKGNGIINISQTTGHGDTINIGTDFAGTVNYTGNMDYAKTVLGSENAKLNLTNVWFWANGQSGTLEQDITFNGAGNKLDNGTLTLNGDITWSEGAKFSMTGGTLNLGGNVTLSSSTFVKTGGTLNLGGGTTTFDGDFTVAGNVALTSEIKVNSGTVALTNTDSNSMKGSLDIGGGDAAAKVTTTKTDLLGTETTSSTYIIVRQNGELYLEKNRWEISSARKISLENGGKITGDGDDYGALDFNADNTVTATGTGNEISASIRLRTKTLTFDVAEKSDLTVGGVFNKYASDSHVASGIIKTGSGTLTLSGDNSGTKSLKSVTVNAGTLVAANANALGTGAVVVNGGTLDFNFESGETTLKNVTTTGDGKITVTAGTVAVDANTVLNVSNLTVVSAGTVSGWGNLSVENLSYKGVALSTARENSVSLATNGVISVTGKDLVWNGTDGSNTWNTSTDNTNWTSATDSSASESFYNMDNVSFTGTGASTVALVAGETVGVGTMSVTGGSYTLAASADGTATLAGNALTIAAGASLAVGDKGNNTSKHVVIDFNDVSVSGTLNFNTINAHTWSSVTLNEGGKLHLEDGSPASSIPVNLTLKALDVAGDATIDFAYDKHLKVNSLSGAGDLTVTGGSSSQWGHAKVTIDALSDYSGTLAMSNGSGGLTLNLGIEGKTMTSTANVVVNGGTLNIAGTTTVGTLTLGNATVNAGTATTVANLVMGQGDGGQTASVGGALTVSGNLTQTGIDNGEKLIVKAGGSISVSGYAFTDDSGNTKLSQSVITLEEGASFSAKSITHTDGLTINLGKDATVSTGVMTLNAVWENAKVHSLVAEDGVTGATVNVDGLEIGSNRTATSDSTTFNVTNIRLNVGSGGIMNFGTGTSSKTMVLTNATLGVRDSATSWSSDVATTLTGTNTLNVGAEQSITLGGVLSGSGKLVKTGTGTLTLFGENDSSANYYTGGTEIRGGILKVQSTAWSNGDADSTWNQGDIGGHITQDYLKITGGGTLEVVKAQDTTNAETYGTGGALRGFVVEGKGTYKYSGAGTSYIATATDANAHIGLENGKGSELTFDVVENSTLDVSKVIAAVGNNGANTTDGALVKAGAGTLVLSGANQYTGGTTVSKGTLVAGNANALGSGNVKVESGATLSLNTETLSVKNLSGEGKIMLAKDTTKNAVLTVTSDENTTFSGTITTGVLNDTNDEYSVGLTKEGTGMLTLTAETGFSGGEVKINAGTLYAGSSAVLVDSSVSVAGGASLRVAPNSGVYGVYANSFTFNENAQLLVDLGTLVMPASTEGATTDSITLDVLVSSAIKFGDTTLVAGDAINLPENYVSLENASAFDEWTKTWSYTNDTLSLTMTIPEPSMFGLLAGLGALALVGTRRRPKKSV